PELPALQVALRLRTRTRSQERLERADHRAEARVTRIAVGEVVDRVVREDDVGLTESVLAHQARQQLLPCDLRLLFGGVAGDADLGHQLAQVARNPVEIRCGCHEQHARQVERHADVVVDEHRAILPLERFLERLDRVAVDLAEPDLIHLLEVEERIAYSDVAQRGNDLARLRADARPSRTDDLRLAASAQLETRERPTESFRKRTHERALAHVRRPDDARDRSDEVAAQARDGELIEQSLL